MTLRDWTVLGVIVFIAAGLRLAALDSPERLVLDEFWYARDGCYYWRGAEAECGLANLVAPDRDVDRMLADYGELTPEHPPLGKLLIGAPVKAFGFSPRPWRLAAALAGVLMVALLFLFVKRALGSTTAAAGASLLLAIDYPHFIHSRLGMLDIFVGLFALAAFYFCLLDHAQTESRAAGTRSHYGWRLAAGLAAGAATASKLSGAAVVLGVLGLVIASEATVRRRRGPPWERLGASAASIFLLLLVVPLGVYLATYAGRLDGSLLALPWDEGAWPRSWVERQADMVQLQADKPSSPASRWSLPMTEPPLPYVLEPSGENVRELLLFGNPLLWWGGFAAVALAALRWRKDGFTAGVIVVGFFSAFAGWLFLTVTRSPVHLYHAVPVIPFLYLALAYLFEKVAAFRVGRVTSIVVFAVSIGAFAFYLPILTASEIDRGQWRPRACSAQVLWLDPKPECGLRAAKPAVGPRLGKPYAATGSGGRVAAAALLLHRDMGTRGLASALIRPRPPESHPSASAAAPASARTESGKPADRQAPAR